MAVSRNNPVTTAPFPEYIDNRIASTLVYNTTAIDATNYTNVTLDFNWICDGEVFFDFGTVLYSFDGTNWATLPGFYEGQNTQQTVTNLDLSAVDGQQFYLGFGWDNDNTVSSFPGFIIDDIDVKGTLLPTCTVPNQPTALNLTPTGNTINGSFTAAVPAPSNYLVVVSPSPSVAPTPINGTTYTIGQALGTGTVVDIDNDTLFTATGLNPSTAYDIYIFSYNTTCVGAPTYNPTNPLTGTISTTSSVYCTPLTTNNPAVKYINDVEFIGTLNDVSNFGNGFSNTPSGYQDFTGLPKSIQQQGEGVNIYVGSSTGRGLWKAWVDWNKDGDFTDAGEQVYDTGGIATSTTTFGFVIPATQTIGDYRVRIRFYNAIGYYNGAGFACDGYYEYLGDPLGNFTSCASFTGFTGTINYGCGNRTVTWLEYGEAEDYLFTVVQNCPAKITSITNGSSCGSGAVNLNVAGNPVTTGYNWYDAETGGNLIASTTTGTWSPVVATTTTFWVTASDGNCESLKRTKIIATINPITTLTFSPANPTVCGENDIITLTATGDTEIAFLIDEDFESGGLGVFTNNNIATNQNANTMWQNRTSTYVPSLPIYQVWFPAISSGFGTNRFVMATSDVPTTNITHNALESATLDSSTFTDLTLNFDLYFSRYLFNVGIPEDVKIEVSTNGGGAWTTVQTYDNDIGYGTKMTNLTVNLNAYINQANLKIRVKYYANYWCDGTAIDNIKLYGSRPLTPSFTWSGGVDAYTNAVATIPYIAGTPISTVYIKPTLVQLENAVFTITANATLNNGCTITKDIDITNTTKIWKGLTSTDWNNANNWRPSGIPTSNNCVIISDIGAGTDSFIKGPPLPPSPAFAKNVTIKSDAILELESETSLTITDWLNVNTNGIFYMKNNSSLVQVNNVLNTGDIFVERAPANGAAVSNLNYVYWSSPVNGFNLDNVSPNSGLKWKWNPTTGSVYGNWIDASSNSMVDGQGYIVRGLSGVVANPSVTLTANSTLFDGAPNNGNISTPISRGNYDVVGNPGYPGFNGVTAYNEDDNWNLIGNPYPSAISANSFIERNSASSIPNNNYGNFGLTTNQKIIGSIWLWPHTGLPSAGNTDPFYNDFGSNYGAQYIAYNFMGSTTGTFKGSIASGQAFFVLVDHNNAAQSGDNVLFHNGMRDATFSNNNFLRSVNSNNPTNLNRHRIWLNLVDSENKAQAILVGYTENATNDRDGLYDAPQFTGSSFSFYSLIDNNRFAIQGKAIPFTDEDIIPLGLVIPQSNIYKIAINQVDGLFENEAQNIYLEDTYTNTIHNLRTSPYSFTTETGTFDNRFVLRYNAEALSVNQFENNSDLIIYVEDNLVKLKSEINPIKSVIVYNVLGQTLIKVDNIDNLTHSLYNLKSSKGVLLVKAKLSDGREKIQKIIY